MFEPIPDNLSDPPDEPVVHWMERPPMEVRPPVLAAALSGVFVLGALAGAGLLALMHAGRRRAG
jgi:hypothetical protein